MRWEQKAPLPQRDRATPYVCKFVLFHKLWELATFKTPKVTSKVIQRLVCGAIR